MRKDYYVFPAIFQYDNDGISIFFPDLPGCFSCAKTDEEALYMAKDALGLHICNMENDGDDIPEPTKLKNVNTNKNQKSILVEVNMPIFRESVQNTAIKKTLTIPKWINDLAEKNNVNFSQVLQTALKQYLGVK